MAKIDTESTNEKAEVSLTCLNGGYTSDFERPLGPRHQCRCFCPGSRVIMTFVLWAIFMPCVRATRLVSVLILDREVVMVSFKDGDIVFRDDAKGPSAYLSLNDATENSTVLYGNPLQVALATTAANWKIRSNDDSDYGSTGRSPSICYRKSKINGMGQYNWNTAISDFNYDTPMQHHIYLVMPAPLKENCTYTVDIDPGTGTGTDKTVDQVTFDIFNSRSEAIHVNINGYSTTTVVKSADVYHWMGDGQARDYSAFTGNRTYLYHIDTKTKIEAGELTFWKNNQREVQHNFTQSDVWIADFFTGVTPGNYRIAIEGIGCSNDFEIKADIYKTPFDVSVRGFYYMRIGEDCMECVPVPRRPLYIQDVDPPNTKIYITAMHPYHPEWGSFSSGDYWDNPNDWRPYMKAGAPTNPLAKGGHSDAYDWDRHLGHVSIIYDMLLPFYLTGGILTDDNCGIRESGNGIPDLLDEARNEVDFWLNLRDGAGYSHGLTNPNNSNELFQAGTTAMAAWANAVNCASLAWCFQLIDNKALEKQYLDSALVAFNYAMSQPDRMLDRTQGMGDITVRGKDLLMTAAAFLYNLTGENLYENLFNAYCEVRTPDAVIADNTKFQTWGIAAYLSTGRPVNYPGLYENIKRSVISEAHRKEADYINVRPSRRGTDNDINWFHTSQNMHRTMIAHTLTDDPDEKDFFLKALTLEADWGLGRNPLNMIQMTTATTPLEHKRSVVNIYTSGRNDGTPGMHPGHTPYLNAYDWGGLIMGNPSWLTGRSYPSEVSQWPMGEIYFDTRYVYAHSEFTPQQTMRGKMALYGYLYALAKQQHDTGLPAIPKQSASSSGIKLYPNPASGPVRVTAPHEIMQGDEYILKIFNMSGQLQMLSRIATHETVIDISHLPAGIYIVSIEAWGITVSAKLTVSR